MTPLRRRVLIVDDDPAIRHMLTSLLLEEGYAVRTAEDGEYGLRIAANWQPHVILLDLVMPRMNGFAFAEEYRRLSATLVTRASVLVMSAAGPAALRAAAVIQADEVIAKPYAIDRLLELITYHAQLRAGE